jgi:uncharacterized membrane protein YgdD (TMEM256/DUF423 family)
MSTTKNYRIASLLGASGVMLGALGAHGFDARLAQAGMTRVWDQAVFYHLVHAVAYLALIMWAEGRSPSRARRLQRAATCWLIGICFFSGSLYALALGAPHWIGPVTPIGGLALILGWVLIASAGATKPEAEKNS